MDTEPWVIEILRKIELEHKDKFEKTYGVEIHSDALSLACNITFKYSDVLLSDDGGIGDNHAVVLKNKAVEMVEKACEKLRHDLDTNVEEKALNFEEYSLRRTLVEFEEYFREKDPAKNLWYPHVKMDYDDFMNKLERFTSKWKLTVLSWNSTEGKRAEEMCMLEQAHQMLVSRLQETEVANGMDSNLLSGVGQCVTKLMLTIDENYKQIMTVTPCLIAEVASPLTGIPASWLLDCSGPPLQGLELRLAKALSGQEHVPSVICNAGPEHVPSVICNALSRPRVVCRPIGSFLFLDGFGQGWTQIATALAEQLFDDKKRLIAFDLSEYSDSGSVSRLIGSPASSSNLTEGLLTKAVKSMPFTVVLFHHVDRAHPSVTDVLIEIISHGRASNGQGSTIDFTKTLIIMTSNVMDGKIGSWRCKCDRMVRKIPLKDLSPDPLQQGRQCYCLDILKEVKNHFRHDLFENLDDVVFFKVLFLEDHGMAAVRLQLRDIASSMSEKRLILYPSDAALRYILRNSDEYDWRIWLEKNVVPSLSHILVENEVCTIYIDALVGQQELSYRLEKGAYQGECMYFKQFMEYLRVRDMYLKEKERVNNIYLLRRNLFKLINLLDAETRADLDSVLVARELVKTLHDLKRNANKDSFMLNVCKKVHLKPLKEDLQLKPIERHYKRPKSGVQGLRMKLSNAAGQHQAIDVVVETLLDSIDAQHDKPQPAMSFLFLGLTGAGEADLVGCLAKLLVADDGMNLLIHIDFSEYTESDSLSRFLNGPLELPYGHEQCSFSLLEAVRMRPHSILVFSQVEKAHMSVFSALLLILDRRKFSIDGGHTVVDFGKTIFIFALDLGNKAILSRLVIHSYQDCDGHGDCDLHGDCDSHGATEQDEKRGFRFELVNRVDEIVFFSPVVREQLRKVARLSMRAGPHLEYKPPLEFPMAFRHLFKMANDPFYKEMPDMIDRVASIFSEWITTELVEGWKQRRAGQLL